METQVEQLDGDRVRLTVEVPAHDVQHAVEHATHDLSATGQDPRLPAGQGAAQGARLSGSARSGCTRRRSSRTSAAGSGAPPRRRAFSRSSSPSTHTSCPRPTTRRGASPPSSRSSRSRSRPTGRQLEVPKLEVEIPDEAVQQQLEELQRIAAEVVPVEGRPAQDGDVAVVDLVADGQAQRDYVVELGAGRLIEEIEAAIAGLGVGASQQVAYELADGTEPERDGHAEGALREGPAAARRRLRPVGVRVRQGRRAARRHRGPHPRAARRGDRRPLSAPLPSTSS